MVRHPRGSYIIMPIAVSGVAAPETVTNWRCHPKQESWHKVPKSVLRAVLGRMQFTLHATRRTPHGASLLVQAMSSWLVKTRRAPSRHSRDTRVYGHTTTAMHKLCTPPPPPPPPPHTPPPPPHLKSKSARIMNAYPTGDITSLPFEPSMRSLVHGRQVVFNPPPRPILPRHPHHRLDLAPRVQ